MKMRKCLTLIILSVITLFPNYSEAYDDKSSHPLLTDVASEASISKYKLDNYLRNNLGLKDGFNTRFGIMGGGRTITEWIKQGSIDEDTPLCRASNHFHNPLPILDWDKSEMSDHPAYIGAYCAVMWGPWYSNVTWATGFKSRNGDKVTFDDIRLYLLEE